MATNFASEWELVTWSLHQNDWQITNCPITSHLLQHTDTHLFIVILRLKWLTAVSDWHCVLVIYQIKNVIMLIKRVKDSQLCTTYPIRPTQRISNEHMATLGRKMANIHIYQNTIHVSLIWARQSLTASFVWNIWNQRVCLSRPKPKMGSRKIRMCVGCVGCKYLARLDNEFSNFLPRPVP